MDFNKYNFSVNFPSLVRLSSLGIKMHATSAAFVSNLTTTGDYSTEAFLGNFESFRRAKTLTHVPRI